MMAKPVRALELQYPMIQFLNRIILQMGYGHGQPVVTNGKSSNSWVKPKALTWMFFIVETCKDCCNISQNSVYFGKW